ncbi:immune inhibitor A, partial [bacterium]|nr:immune inhibitor A [bacterium]
MRMRPDARGRHRIAVLALSLLAVLVATSSARDDVRRPTTKVPVVKVPAERLYAGPAGDAQRAREQRRVDVLVSRNHLVHEMLGGRHVSRLSRERLAAAGLGPARRDPTAAAKQAQVTLKVLLVRIGFETDRSGDLTSVTADGDFQLRAPTDADIIDPPPHDRAYFEAHLAGLSEYYGIQSDGRLAIDSVVLPASDTGCYKLGDLADYAPGADGYWTVGMLEALVRDIIELTDEQTALDYSVRFADYDDDDPLTYVIFVHAGADWQSDINQDSPNDIPTFFVALGEPVALASLDTETGEPGQLSECSIIPETTSQDGWLGSIAGALYHEFGHALGLPDVYDTTTGLPAVGYWDLMDSGPNLISNIGLYHPTIPDSIEVYSVAGVLPPSLSAWCRWYLGWLETGVLGGAETEVHLPAVQVRRNTYNSYYGGTAYDGTPYDFDLAYPQALVGGVSPREFYLLENRWVPLSSDELPDETGIGFVRDSATGVFLYMGGDAFDPDGPGPLPATWRNTGMYDFFLPDGGLLVWHVNQDRIDWGLAENTINAYGDGLRLLEADGIQDVGVYEAYVLGFFGSQRDPFHAGTTSALPQEGRPGTRAYDYSWTGLELRAISANDATMTFDAQVSPLTAAPPVRLPSAGPLPRLLDPESVTPWRLAGAAPGVWTEVLVYASQPVAGMDGAGEPAFLFLTDQAGGVVTDPVPDAPAGVLLPLSAPLAGPPVVATFAGTGRDHLVYGTRDGGVGAYLDVLAAGVLVPSWGPVSAGDTLAFAPTVAHLGDGSVRLLCCLEPGRLQIVDETGARVGAAFDLGAAAAADVGRFASPPRAVQQPFGIERYLVVTETHWFLIAPETESGDPLAQGALAVAPDERGRLRTALWEQDTESRLFVFGNGGAEYVRFRSHLPVERGAWDPHFGGELVGAPAVADLDGDGRHDLIMLTSTHLYAAAVNGAPLAGFPLELLGQFPLAEETRLDGGIVVFDATGDGRNEMYVTTDGGHLLGFDATGRLLGRLPLLWGDRGLSSLLVSDAPDGGRVLWLADTGGRPALGAGSIAAGGRIAGFLPPSAGRATGTSEWLGPLGGRHRRGTTGTPADLGALSTLAAERSRSFVYPNPARGDAATFRYFSPVAGEARL